MRESFCWGMLSLKPCLNARSKKLFGLERMTLAPKQDHMPFWQRYGQIWGRAYRFGIKSVLGIDSCMRVLSRAGWHNLLVCVIELRCGRPDGSVLSLSLREVNGSDSQSPYWNST